MITIEIVAKPVICWQLFFRDVLIEMHRPVSSAVELIAIGAGDLGFVSQVRRIGHSVATDATFARSCVAQALSRGDGARHLLHASA